MKIREDYNSRKIHKPPQNVKNIDQDASLRRTRVETTPLVQKPRSLMMKLPTKDAECKHNGMILEAQSSTTTTTSCGALISMEGYLNILLEGDDCESWCKPLSEYVIPGPIPDFDALDFDYAIDFSQFFC